jgi:uncharacterized protein (DUF1800 family)
MHKTKARGLKTSPQKGNVNAVAAGFLGMLLAATCATILVANGSYGASPTPGAAAAAALANHDSGKPTAEKLSKAFKGKLPITELTEDEAALHALNRLGYGPRPDDLENVRRMGLDKWIERQLHPDSIDDAALDQRLLAYPTLSMSSQEVLEKYPPENQAAKKQGLTKDEYKDQMDEKRRAAIAQVRQTSDADRAQIELAKIQGPRRIVTELSMGKLDRAVYSDRQLEAVMEDFWFNHFNVFENKGADRWMLTAYVRDSIRPHTMGKFQDLLLATAKSPAMLFFLDNWLSADPLASKQYQQEMAARRRRYQGIFMGGYPPGTFPGNPTAGAAGANQKKQQRGINENYGREVMELHTLGVDGGYTQQDVIEMAKCLTGWTVKEPRKDPRFFFDDRIHTNGKKVVLGRTFNYGGMKDGEEALKMLANELATAHFISTEIARHFVSDDPPATLVDRMARTFSSSHGEIHEVLKTMIYSPEFWSRETYRAKVKTPFELAASTARALNSEVAVPVQLVQWVGRMGEPLFQCQPPTGYSDKAETWVNTGSLLNRLNFAMTLAGGKMLGTSVDMESLLGKDATGDPEMALARALDVFLDSQVAPATHEVLEQRLNDPQIVQAKLDDPVKHVNEGMIAGLVLGAPEFQRR